MLDKSFQEFFYRVDNWIDEGSGWVNESIGRRYVDISTLSPLSGSTYIEFPRRLRNSMKGQNMVNSVDYEGIIFPVSKKDLDKIEKKNIICISVFCCENNLFYPLHISDQKIENCMDLLMITDKNKSHYVYIKDFYRFMCNKANNKNKKHFCRYCFS